MSGVVIDGPLQGAKVCLDLNDNGMCDLDEPSATTDSTGAYAITGVTAAQAAAALVAVVPPTSIDASTGTAVGLGFTLSSPAGKGSVISPITTLVQAGVKQGMSLANAEAAAARQLNVAAGNLYLNYVGASSGDGAVLAAYAPLAVLSLQSGSALSIAAPTAGSPGYWLRSLAFTDTKNYSLRMYYSANSPGDDGLYKYFDVRVSKIGGYFKVPYSDSLYESAQGWVHYNGATVNSNSSGNPYYSVQGGTFYASAKSEADVSGQSIASVLARVEDLSVNSFSTITGVNAGNLSGTMPAGSRIRTVTSVGFASPTTYSPSDGYIASVSSVQALVAAFPRPATAAGTNTVAMGLLHGSGGCGSTFCAQESLRVAFGANNAATYYLCDEDLSTGAISGCTTAGTGTYAIGKAADGVTPVITFASLPAAQSIQSFTRVFVERNGHVYYGWQNKASPKSVSTRLNDVAFGALASALGIAAPTAPAAPSPFGGIWSASYTGSDTGTCSSLFVDAFGLLSGACSSGYTLAGSANSAGSVTFSGGGGGPAFVGTLDAAAGTGTGTWANGSFSGTWTAARQP